MRTPGVWPIGQGLGLTFWGDEAYLVGEAERREEGMAAWIYIRQLVEVYMGCKYHILS